jgi:hypothetical protein
MEVSINLRLPTELVQQIDAWRASQPALPSRQQFIRYVVDQFFQQADATRPPPKRKAAD